MDTTWFILVEKENAVQPVAGYTALVFCLSF
jgi:hypothetical protein